jgi:hypothetical protein
MATVTPNFNWPVPTSTDLVKDGATAIEALGDSIDGSLVDLKGGTTGQVLSKTSGTDMDFTWVTTDDANAIQNSIVDAKGDLISATANDTPARLAVGANGETLVADSSTSTGLRYQANFAAGKNAIINGDFGVWQRGTSFSVAGSTAVYGADRFYVIRDGSGATFTMSQQTFTPGTAPVAGYEGTYYCRLNQSVAGTGGTFSVFVQKIEDVRKFAGQTVTISFWAKANATIASTPVYIDQIFGTGGSSGVTTTGSVSNITTSWQRFSVTYAVPSISGKTIGTGSSLNATFYLPVNSTYTLDIWGVQLEAGSVATAFQTATGTIQGELAACQRYYYRTTSGTAYAALSHLGQAVNTTTIYATLPVPTKMRVIPTSFEYSSLTSSRDGLNSGNAITNLIAGYTGSDAIQIQATTSGLTQYDTYYIYSNNSSTAFIGVSAEL